MMILKHSLFEMLVSFVSKSHDEEYIESLIEQQEHNAKLHKLIVEEELQTNQTKRKQHDALIDELVSVSLE